MRVAALELPRLGLQALLRERPALAGAPALLWERTGGREIVVALSPAAERLGLSEGQALAKAKALVPGLVALPRDPAGEAKVRAEVAEALLALAPYVEVAAPEALLLDPSAARFVPPSPSGAGESQEERAWAEAVLDCVRALGLWGRIAVADTAAAARLLAAGNDGPGKDGAGKEGAGKEGAGREKAEARVRVVAPGRQLAAVRRVPLALVARLCDEAARAEGEGRSRDAQVVMGGGRLLPILDHGAVALLGALGVRRLGEVLELPPRALVERLGVQSEALLELARGGRPRPLQAFWPQPPLVERVEFDGAVESAEGLVFAVRPLLERLEARLAGRGGAVTRLGLVLEMEGQATEVVESIPEAAAPPRAFGAPRRRQVERVLELARPASRAGVLFEAVRERLSAWVLPAPVVGCAIDVRETTRRDQQLELGERPQALEALDAVLARLQARLGEEALGSPRPMPDWIPERAVTRRPFRPGPVRTRGFERVPRSERRLEAEKHEENQPLETDRLRLVGEAGGPAERRARATTTGTEQGAPPERPLRVGARPTRMFPPEAVAPELDGTGAPEAVAWRGRRQRIVERSQPERLATGWWRGGAVRDYCTWLLGDGCRVWVYRDLDGQWWVQGVHD